MEAMAEGLEHFLRSSLGLKLAAALAKALPPALGYSIADAIAGWIARRRDSGFVRAVRYNQSTVAPGENPRCQDKNVQEVFRNSGRSTYDLYRYVDNARAIERMYDFDAACNVFLNRREFDDRGLILAALHTPGFDLGLRWLCRDRLKFKPIVLTIPDPEGGRQVEFEERQKAGMRLLPGSVEGLRESIRYLQRGGLVITGIDHPLPQCDPRPRFFGGLADLPMHHVYLALKAQVPIVVEVSRLEDDGKYHVHASPPIEMEPYPKRTDALVINAERILAVAEDFIRQVPSQWLMFLPVWPGASQGIER